LPQVKHTYTHDQNVTNYLLCFFIHIKLADLVGFTAWSSARDPTQVFILLETIFIAFDEIAIHYNIFKVETVGGT
jgi:Adenylate and Guanylate cyclase catalytic domain